MTGARHGGYVLAGGRSSRMGSDKALLKLGDATLLERASAAVAGTVGSAVIVGDPARYTRFGYPVIQDSFRGAGPLGGIHAALTHASAEKNLSDWSLVVACDMPGLDSAWLLRLVAAIDNQSDAVVPESAGRPQPLCSLYRRTCLPAFEEALRNGRFKILDALARLRVARLEMDQDERFRNVNTPEDWSLLALL
jgi:molybdopterin-guanine dinucleotide biosynthesis protein A